MKNDDAGNEINCHRKGSTSVIRGTNWIGDAVAALPAVASVRAAYPKAHLAILAKPPVSDIYQLFSAADEIIPYEKKFDTPIGVFRLAYALRSKKFDAAILLQNAIEAAIMTLAAGIPLRAGYNSDGRGFLLTHPIRRTAGIFKVHQIDYYLEMVKALGCANVDRTMHLETNFSRKRRRNFAKAPAGKQETVNRHCPGRHLWPGQAMAHGTICTDGRSPEQRDERASRSFRRTVRPGNR